MQQISDNKHKTLDADDKHNMAMLNENNNPNVVATGSAEILTKFKGKPC
jgi:hypothetical protein